MIIIAGQAGVGKTTLAHLIAKKSFELGLTPVILSFASSLKKMAVEQGFAKDRHPEKYREFCQNMGASKRSEDEDYWVKLFQEEVERIYEQEQTDLKEDKKFWERCIIVDDCRYANEIKAGLDRGATMIFMSYGDRESFYPDNDWKSHESEEMANLIESDPEKFKEVFDYIIENDGTVEQLDDVVESMTPYWVNIKTKNEEHFKKLSECVANLIDLLLLSNLEEDEEDDD